MKWKSLSFFIFLHGTIIGADQLFTFRNGAQYTGYKYPYQNHQSRNLVCISDNPSDALIWNTNLVWNDSSLAFIDNNQRRSMLPNNMEYDALTCKFNDEHDPCFSSWLASNSKWTVVSSLDEPMGPIFDSRWEELQEYPTFNQEGRTLKLFAVLGDKGVVVVSIRGTANAHFFLCQSSNYATDFCYWIILGGWGNNVTGIRRCDKGIGNGGYRSIESPCKFLHNGLFNHMPLSTYEWRTFIIKWDGRTNTISIYDPQKLILTYTDEIIPSIKSLNSSREHYFFFDNPHDDFPKIYRFHDYNYTLTKEADAELMSAKFISNDSNDICIEMLLGLCSDCDLELSILDDRGKSLRVKLFVRHSTAERAEHSLPMWQHAKIRFENITTSPASITVRIATRLTVNLTGSNYHWAIANVQRCLSKGVIKKTFMVAKQDWDKQAYAYVWPKVTCQKLSYDAEGVMIVDPNREAQSIFESPAHENGSSLCPSHYIGPFCATQCGEFLSNNCQNVVMCDVKSCYCTQGMLGENCDQYCYPGSYGFTCSQKCGSCAQTYSGYEQCNIYTGKCSECQTFSEKYLIPPYCQMAVESPPPPLIKILDENSVQVHLPQLPIHTKINSSIFFELKKYNGPSHTQLLAAEVDALITNSAKSYTVKFLHLVAGMQYNIRMLMTIHTDNRSNQVKVLNGEWSNVTMPCQKPSAVRDLTFSSIEKTEIEIFWTEPLFPNGIINGYRIMLYLTQYRGCTSEKKEQLGVDLHIRTFSEISPSSTSHIISDLIPYAKYTIKISAYNSKSGIESNLKVDTPAIDVPIEKFVNLSFNNESSVLAWQDPNCTTWTGPVRGARLFFTGISTDVSNFQDMYNTKQHSFTLNNSKLHGLETYRVRIHVLRNYPSTNYNREIFSELVFTTTPSPPPAVENLEIVEIDSQNFLTTLRWQKPLSPQNGHIIRYSIEFVSYNTRRGNINVQTNETCSLWKHWLCKTVQQPKISPQFIEVRAINKDVMEPGKVSRIQDYRNEQAPDEPQSVTFRVSKNGIVDLQWHHPWKTGSPMKIFRIRREVRATNLRKNLTRSQNISYIDSPISIYQQQYNIRMYLMPSTSYEIYIQGVSRTFSGKTAALEVQTHSALAFGYVQKPVINYKKSQIDLVIPSVINDTKNSIMHIIAIGPSTCQQASLLTDSLRKDVDLEYYKTGWLVATFTTAERANSSFTIGNGDINDGVINCPLVGGSYVIAYLVYERKIFEKVTKPLVWKSELIHVGPIPRTSHEVWVIPFGLLIIVIAGIAWYFFKKRNKKSITEVKNHSQDSGSVPAIPPKNLQRVSYRSSTLLALESDQTVSEMRDCAQVLDLVPVIKKSNENPNGLSTVKLNEFQDYVEHAIASGDLIKQYKILPRGQTKPWEYGSLPENKMKNRYANLIAYDETRVILEKIPDDPYSDYINANYIKGYEKNRAYIATQGPKPNTIIDFWRMIWQERVQVICMLANVVEGGKQKCEQYWPEIGRELNVGNIIVANVSHSTFADYTFRLFHVTCDQETRKIDQLHYTAWPDHGVPLYTQSVATYLKKLLATPVGHGPIVVHCSAGIGRTGTIILCDICLRRAAAEGVVDVFAETEALRNQRANMVDNEQQYLLAHLTLVECLLTLPTQIPCNEALPKRIQEYKKQLSFHRQRLEEAIWRDEALQSSSKITTKMSDKNIAKCRYPELAAVVGSRLYISRYPTTDDDSNYMFGVYVDSARRKNNYIASQLPLPSTVNDFWRMVAEFTVEVIIVLQPPDEEDPTCCLFVPEYNEELKPTPYLTLKGREPIDNDICTSRKILLTDCSEKPAREQSVKVLLLKGWESGKNKPPPKPITLVDFWQNAERIPRGDGPTVVLCHDGVTNCGLYLALSFLLERMGLERECDVCLAIRAIRRSRPEFCNDPEQFEYLYDAAVIYAACFETYANFT